MEERLQKLISSCGLASRRTAEAWITAGRVTVNGVPAQLGDRADLDRDRVEVDGVPLRPGEARTYLMLYKPRGYVTTLSDEKGRKTVAALASGCGRRVWPVGRLDLDSEGLLLMTDDGALTNQLLHPRHQGRGSGPAHSRRPHGAGWGAPNPRPGAAGADLGGGHPAVGGHPTGEKPAGAAHVRPGRPGGEAAQAHPGGGTVAGPKPEAGPVAAPDGGGTGSCGRKTKDLTKMQGDFARDGENPAKLTCIFCWNPLS